MIESPESRCRLNVECWLRETGFPCAAVILEGDLKPQADRCFVVWSQFLEDRFDLWMDHWDFFIHSKDHQPLGYPTSQRGRGTGSLSWTSTRTIRTGDYSLAYGILCGTTAIKRSWVARRTRGKWRKLVGGLHPQKEKVMPKPLDTLSLFPNTTYQSREEYEKTGLPCPAWDALKPPKYWMDPGAQKAGVFGGIPMALYSRIYAGYNDATQLPIWDQLFISVADAKVVNIPPTGTGNTNVPGADVPAVPVPVRELADDEVVKKFGVMGIPMVYTASEMQTTDVGFTLGDRTLLERIATKLGA